MLRIVKGTLRRLRRYRIAQAPKRITELRRRTVRLTGTLQGKDEAHQFLGGVGDGDIVMLAFSPLFCQISGEGSIPMADVLCGVVERVAKVTGAAFLHVRIGVNLVPNQPSARYLTDQQSDKGLWLDPHSNRPAVGEMNQSTASPTV